MTTALQESLLDLETEPALRGLPGAIHRRALAQGAWVDHLPGWVSGSGALFERLAGGVPWRGERRRMYDRDVTVPRLLAWFGEGATLPDPVLADARDALDGYYAAQDGDRFVTAGLCLYRDGRDSVAWHGDTQGRDSTQDTRVAIVSLGTPRAFLLRPRGGGESLRFCLGHGDLLVMGGSCQRTWEHAVPKTARPVGPRISVQLRPRGVR